MSIELLNWFSYISTIFSIIPLLIGVICIRTIKNDLIPIFLIVIISAGVEILNMVVGDAQLNNLPILHIYTVFEFTLIYVFYLQFYKQYVKLNVLYIILPIFYIVTYFDYKLNGLNELDSFSVTVESSIFIVISVISFSFIMRNLIFENIVALPFFWINSGVLIYFSGNILLFIFSNSLNKSEIHVYYMLWSTIHSLLNVIYNTVICIAFWKTRHN